MSRVRAFFRTSFGSAVLGGAVVAAFGMLAISAGWVDAGDGGTTIAAAPLATPAVDTGDRGSANTVVNQIYQRDGQGVAFIQAQRPARQASPFDPFGESGGGVATGSGFLIDTDGRVLTNNHVVSGAKQIQVKLGDSETAYGAEVVGTDPATDLALLKIDAPSDQLHPIALGDSSEIEVGDPVVAIGNPFGLDRTVTSGIVSALQRQIEAPNGFAISNVIQTDAAINPGNSGGPLIDADGRVVGINSQIETGGAARGNVGIGFAIPINTARDVVAQLESGGEVKHAFLGITGATIDSTLAQAVKLPVSEGVLVQDVVQGGPADKAGIEGGDTSATIGGAGLSLGGDIITAVDGKEVSTMDEVVTLVNEAQPGDTIDLSILRGGSTKTLTVTLGDRPNSVPGADSAPSSPFGN
jgi:S1-C subfamily serine protease